MKKNLSRTASNPLAREIGERLKLFMKDRQLKQKDVAAALEMLPSALGNSLTRNFLSHRALIQLAKTYSVNLNWLLTGHGASELDVGDGETFPDHDGENRIRVRYAASLQAFDLAGSASATGGGYLLPSRLVPHPSESFVTRVPDNSMHPLLQKDWVVAIDASPRVRAPESVRGEVCLVELPGGTRALRWVHRKMGVWEIRAEDPEVRPLTVDSPTILGKVLFWLGNVREPSADESL